MNGEVTMTRGTDEPETLAFGGTVRNALWSVTRPALEFHGLPPGPGPDGPGRPALARGGDVRGGTIPPGPLQEAVENGLINLFRLLPG